MLAFGLILAFLLEIAMAQATDACDSCESAKDDGEFAFNLFSDVAPYVLDSLCAHSIHPCRVWTHMDWIWGLVPNTVW